MICCGAENQAPWKRPDLQREHDDRYYSRKVFLLL